MTDRETITCGRSLWAFGAEHSQAYFLFQSLLKGLRGAEDAAALFLTHTALIVIKAALCVLTDVFVDMDNVLTEKINFIHIH